MQQYKTRIQLKSDTEANWNKAGPKDGSTGFIPLQGELIIYSADNAHPFCRLKVGNGSTNVVDLPFIDAGTLNGEEVELVKVANFNSLPQVGSSDKLYVDLATNRIYHYETNKYYQLSNFEYSISTNTIAKITSWRKGTMTSIALTNNTLVITNGTAPELNSYDITVVTGVTKVVNES